MSPKLARFLDSGAFSTPALICDLDRIRDNFNALQAAFPRTAIYYAVKANPAAPILDTLTQLGSKFDAPSIEEIRLCLPAAANTAEINFANTVKKCSAILEAWHARVNLFGFDSREELHKLAQLAPGARVYCRLAVSQSGAERALSPKFGTDPIDPRTLMVEGADRGLVPYGLSFHVGSQQTGVAAYQEAIGIAAMVFTDLRCPGIDLTMLNIAGGFPIRYREDIPSMGDFAAPLTDPLRQHFGNDWPELMIEPGRGFVGDAGVIVSEVVFACNRSTDGDRLWIYFDIGRFAGLAQTEGEGIRYRISAPGISGPDNNMVIAGRTCDGVYVLYREAATPLPERLGSGDRVLIHDTGAYVTSYASQGFNGFNTPQEHYL